MDKNAAKMRIVELVRAEYERAEGAYRKRCAERFGMNASAEAWDELDSHRGFSGGISQNPYDTILASEREQAARLCALKWRDAYSLAVDTFIIDEEAECHRCLQARN